MADEDAPRQEKEKLPARPAGALSASGTHAVIVAQPAPVGPALPQVSRRTVVIASFWTAMAGMLGGIVVGLVNFMWSRTAQKPGGIFKLDINANDIKPGEKKEFVILQPNKRDPLSNIETKIFLVRLSEEQAKLNKMDDKAGAYLALWRKCPHLGCAVPYLPGFSFADPANDGQSVTGWFRCPCHGSTYSDTGRRVFGPAPRSMDAFGLIIDEDGTMSVDLDIKFVGATDLPGNIVHAVFPGQTPA
jgi:Rieske Fe-S protein